jgi:hypothetical protein
MFRNRTPASLRIQKYVIAVKIIDLTVAAEKLIGRDPPYGVLIIGATKSDSKILIAQYANIKKENVAV